MSKAAGTEIGGDGRGFPATSPTIMQELGSADPEVRRRRLQDLVARYWKPVYFVMRSSWAKTNEDAKDLTQEFFTRSMLEGSLVRSFDPTKGSFRTFLKGALQHFMMNHARDQATLKRGGDVQVLRLGVPDEDVSSLVANHASLPPDRLFDAAWKADVLSRALRNLEEKLRAEGKHDSFRIFQRYDLGEAPEAPSYENLAAEFGMSVNRVKHSLRTARALYRASVTEILRGTVDNAELLEEEIRDLFGA